ncbi:MAG TPA: MFS transporter [Gaiellaceae bacterium]|jgi:EmrB/QacA subfamily drug resistance transporter
MHATEKTSKRRWWALAVLSVAQFLAILDTSIIGVALPDIQDALGFSDSSLQWVFNAYVIAFGGLLLLGGRLADIFGARRVFALGFAVLTGASLVAGFAQSDTVLIAGRAAQGLGAALLPPAAMALVMSLFAGTSEFPKAMGIWGAAAPAGGTAGVFLGGVITEWISWRWTFLINVPVGLVVLAATPRLLPSLAGRRHRVDLAGAATITAAISAAVYAIVTANDNGWGSTTTIGLLAGSAALLGAFVLIERTKEEPLVPLRIFRVPQLASANTVMALLGAAWIPMWFFLNLYLQRVLGYGAFEGGAALLPMTLLIMVLMVGVTGRLVARYGFRAPTVVGLALLAIGIAGLGRFPVGGSFAVDVLVPSLIAAAGMSLAFIPALMAAISRAEPSDAGLASGLVNTTYQVGSALGLAVATAIAANATTTATLTSETHGYRYALVAAALVAAAGAVVAAVGLRSRGTSHVVHASETEAILDEAA